LVEQFIIFFGETVFSSPPQKEEVLVQNLAQSSVALCLGIQDLSKKAEFFKLLLDTV
jgi:hypothetical protein